MGFLQNYLGLEPAYKDGYDLPLLGMMKTHCIEIGRALTGSDLGTKVAPTMFECRYPQMAGVVKNYSDQGAAVSGRNTSPLQ